MKKEGKPSYTPEFQAEAVKLVLAQGLSVQSAAKQLSLPKSTLANWVRTAKSGKQMTMPGARTVAELEVEVAKLRRELTEAQMERDILKKATAYFAKESQKGTRT